MATVVEVQTNKPRVNSLTLKLNVGEASDMLVYIRSYYQKNAPYAGPVEKNATYQAVIAGLEGKGETVKVGSPAVF